MRLQSLLLKLSWLVGGCLLVAPVLAQEDGNHHLDMALSAVDLPETAVVLFVQDSSRAKLAVGEVWLDGQSVWLKRSDQPPTHPDVVHWNYDSTRQMLKILLYPEPRGNFNRLEIRLLPVDRRLPLEHLRVWAGNTAVFRSANFVDITPKITLKK